MPLRALRPCPVPGCRELTRGGRCPKHAAQRAAAELERQREVNARRPKGSGSVYSSPRWREARARYIAQHPRCAHPGCGAPARYLDHVKPWRSFPPEQQDAAFWSEWNWQGLCPTHHSAKTAAEDGGFGNQRRAAP